MTSYSESSLLVFEIQRMSTEDGPGIRTTVFLKGCPLKCRWCQNPESISPQRELIWVKSKCIGCGDCIASCKNKAIALTKSGIAIDSEKCSKCGVCASICPSGAMEMVGKYWEVQNLVNEIEKDYPFFKNSCGGVTLSGGEPTYQKNVIELLKCLKKSGIHTALDTSGMCSKETLKSLLPYVDLILYDLKLIDTDKHKYWTGKTNEIIFQNILYIKDYIVSNKMYPKLWIRTPIVPDATATYENIKGIGKFIRDNLCEVAKRWELCSFNILCKDKYEKLGRDWDFKNCDFLSKDFMEDIVQVAKDSSIPSIVCWTGFVK